MSVPNVLKTVFLTCRPPFLLLTPVCVFLGISLSGHLPEGENQLLAWLVFVGAVCAHISVNALNEYFDFKSGLDLKTDKTPFSGGSGALPAHPAAASATLAVGIVALFITCAIGVYFLMKRGVLILPIGVAGVLLVALYTRWINRMPVFCLLAPGGGFGLLMVVGTQVVLSDTYSINAILVSLIPFLLLNNLLLLNQYPDVIADKNSGRRTFPIVYGVHASNVVYALFLLGAYSLMLGYIYWGIVPALGVIALLPMALSLFALFGALKLGFGIGQHARFLAANVAASLITPLLLGVAFIRS